MLHKALSRCLLISTLLTGCSSPSPTGPGPGRTAGPTEQAAVALGVTVLSQDSSGTPRLLRSVVPRASLAGAQPELAARDHVAALSTLWVHRATPMALTSAGTQTLRNGASVVKLAQQVDGIEVHQGELRVLVHPDGSLAAIAGTLLPTASKPQFTSSPREMAVRALDQLLGTTRAAATIVEGAERGGWRALRVTGNGYTVTSARTKRALFRDGSRMIPVWVVEMIGSRTGKRLPNEPTIVAHRYLIDDRDGKVVRDTDLVHSDAFVYRAYADPSGARRPFDGALKSFAPHPTGTPDGSLPGFAKQNLVVMNAFNKPRDPWLPANATTTSGNNVDAFADVSPPSGFSPGDIRPEVQAGRVLNYSYNHNAEPVANATQSKSATTNAFYIANWLHDWWYDSGFTEATGNAQLDNFGRGGIGGDPLSLRAQDDALGGSRDNAFMATPADGVSPEMHMFLWSTPTEASLVAAGQTFTTSVLNTGPRNFDVSGALVTVGDGAGVLDDGCEPITTDLTGKIALLNWTQLCDPTLPVTHAKARGAIGVVMSFGAPNVAFALPGGTAALPGVVVNGTDAATLDAMIGNGSLPVTLHRVSATRERDGDFDNAIVAHEWGHYLHHRLASCEAGAQCGAMSEGWGDFTALLMMLRTSDDREGTYAPGVYALAGGALAAFGFADPGYFGIRRYPYSTNRTKNPLTFRHIGEENVLPANVAVNDAPAGNGNSEVHNAGEVWAQMMWEAFNVLADEHGVSRARRRMSDYVVAGLLLTPPEATFVEGRDAILAAASALDREDMLLMAAAFAGRGAGSCAVAPDRNDSTNAGVVESGTLAANLETSGVSLVDDGVSCDQDGYLDAGESGKLRVTVANGGVLKAHGVVVTATTSVPGVTIGAPVHIGGLKPFTSVDLEIPVKLAANAPTETDLDIEIRVEGDADCDPDGVVVAFRQRMGVDEVAEIATTDHVQTQLTPWTATGEGAADLWSRPVEATGNRAWFGANAGDISDTQLVSPVLMASATSPLVIKVAHAYNLEGFPPSIFFDGGVLEISTDAGATWRDVTTLGITPGYTGMLDDQGGNPLGGRLAFSGPSPGFPDRQLLTMDFGMQLAGQAVQLRFRIGTDFCCTGSGWSLDDIEVTGIDNTPFPGFVAEASTCTAAAPSDRSTVTTVHTGPETNLRAFDEQLETDPSEE